MICGNCDNKPTISTGANQMLLYKQRRQAYPFCDLRGTQLIPFTRTLGDYAAYKQLTLNRDARLDGKRILAIEIVGTAAAPIVAGVDNIGGVATGWLTLVRQCGQELEIIQEIPLPVMDRTANGNKLYFTDCLPKFGSCYLTFSSGGYGSSNAVQFNFYVTP